MYRVFRVVDCPFNRHWYPNKIGEAYISPPSFAIVEVLVRMVK